MQKEKKLEYKMQRNKEKKRGERREMKTLKREREGERKREREKEGEEGEGEGKRERIKDDGPDKFCFSNGCVVLGCTLTTVVTPEVNTPWYRFC